MQYSILWINKYEYKHGCARECANRLYRVCTHSSSVDDGESTLDSISTPNHITTVAHGLFVHRMLTSPD